MRFVKKIHLVGIGGAGMGGIAEVLFNLGYEVTGSDCAKNLMTDYLSSLGIKIHYQHKPQNIQQADVVVYSSAITKDNPEFLEAQKTRRPIIPRAEMLAELMRFKEGIAIAGTHGKTTTTSLVASIMAQANTDPTFVIGGRLNSAGTNARLGSGKYFIAEADESDASFLHLTPTICAITNIDSDHLNNYNNDFNQLKKAFLEFVHCLPFYGLAVLCQDDLVIEALMPLLHRPFRTYGFSSKADYRAEAVTYQSGYSKFEVIRPQHKTPLQIRLNLPGRHNVQNALAAIAIATEENIADKSIQMALETFQGVGRRFEILGDLHFPSACGLLIDDYGHHPNEIKVVIEAIRANWPNRQLVVVFQPHRYSRTQQLFEKFATVLSLADKLILLEVFSAGENVVPGAESLDLKNYIKQHFNLIPILLKEKNKLKDTLEQIVESGDIILTQGAGDIGKLACHMLKNQPLKALTED